MKLVLAILALAGSAPSLHAQASEPSTAKPEKKICRGVTPTGSIFKKRMCLTRADWAAFDAENRADTDAALRARGVGMCGGEQDNPNCRR